jgi:hypothetical protein
MTADNRQRVQAWLRTIGCSPDPQHDPNAAWNYRIDYPVKTPHVMHVISPKSTPNAVIIGSGTTLAPELLATFSQLDGETQDDFLLDLMRTLNVIEVDFQVFGVQGPRSCPTSFRVGVTRYDDGLTLDSFARSLGAVYKTEMNALFVIQRYLGSGAPGPGGQFDFKRLGL